jgi:hypothetical protein
MAEVVVSVWRWLFLLFMWQVCNLVSWGGVYELGLLDPCNIIFYLNEMTRSGERKKREEAPPYTSIVGVGVIGECKCRHHQMQILLYCLNEMLMKKSRTQAKIWQCGFFWPTMYEDSKDFVKRCQRCQLQGGYCSQCNAPPL